MEAKQFIEQRLIKTEDGKCANTFDVIVQCSNQYGLLKVQEIINLMEDKKRFLFAKGELTAGDAIYDQITEIRKIYNFI